MKLDIYDDYGLTLKKQIGFYLILGGWVKYYNYYKIIIIMSNLYWKNNFRTFQKTLNPKINNPCVYQATVTSPTKIISPNLTG